MQADNLSARLQAQLYESKRVIVYIWTSAGNPTHPGANVGHVAIATPKQYISLWPKQASYTYGQSAKEQEGSGIHQPISHELVPCFSKDTDYEQRSPEIVYCFYSLNSAAIEHEFERVQQTLRGWCLLGLCKDGESCASLAYRLLQAGGIGKLAGGIAQHSTMMAGSSSTSFFKKSKHSMDASGYVITTNFQQAIKRSQNQSTADSLYSVEMGAGIVVKSPDYLAELLAKAKRKELELHPETKLIYYPCETIDINKEIKYGAR